MKITHIRAPGQPAVESIINVRQICAISEVVEYNAKAVDPEKEDILIFKFDIKFSGDELYYYFNTKEDAEREWNSLALILDRE